MSWLAQRSPGHRAAFADPRLVKAAVDQVHAAPGASIDGAREVAFFPPVTGG
jgi:molybdopterin synthase sulfur carrier subunit